MSDVDTLTQTISAEEVAKLKDEKGRVEMGTHPRLSETSEISGKVLDVDKQFTALTRVTDANRSTTLDLMRSTKAKYEPVLYMPAPAGVKEEFFPAVVAHDEMVGETTVINNHVAICDIGNNSILEEAVRDPQNPDKVIDVRYWVKSSRKEALDKAKLVKWGAERDKNNLLSEPLVLEQVSEEAAKKRLGEEKNTFLIRYDDLANPNRGYAMVNSVTEERPQVTPLPPLANNKSTLEDVGAQAEPVLVEEKPAKEAVPEVVLGTSKKEAVDTSAGMKINVAGVEYAKLTSAGGKFTEARFRTADGKELSRDQMIDEIRAHRIGQVDRNEKGDLMWEVQADRIKPLTGEPLTWPADSPVVRGVENPNQGNLQLADKEGLVLANAEELARQDVFSVTYVEGEPVMYVGTEEEKLTNQALDEVVKTIDEHSNSVRLGDISDTDGNKYDIKLTQFLSSDGKRVVIVEEKNEKKMMTTKRIKLIDDAMTRKWHEEYPDQRAMPDWLSQVIDTVKADSSIENVHQVLAKIDNVVGVQQQ